MAKFIMIFFVTLGSGVSYFTYDGAGQERVETVKKEETVRRSSFHYRGSSGGSYGSGGYSYGK